MTTKKTGTADRCRTNTHVQCLDCGHSARVTVPLYGRVISGECLRCGSTRLDIYKDGDPCLVCGAGVRANHPEDHDSGCAAAGDGRDRVRVTVTRATTYELPRAAWSDADLGALEDADAREVDQVTLRVEVEGEDGEFEDWKGD